VTRIREGGETVDKKKESEKTTGPVHGRTKPTIISWGRKTEEGPKTKYEAGYLKDKKQVFLPKSKN